MKKKIKKLYETFTYWCEKMAEKLMLCTVILVLELIYKLSEIEDSIKDFKNRKNK